MTTTGPHDAGPTTTHHPAAVTVPPNQPPTEPPSPEPRAAATSLIEEFFVGAMEPAHREDPYPHYDRFRGGEPLLRAHDTMWLCLTHREVAALLRHPKLSSNEAHATTEITRGDRRDAREQSLLFMDPPDHTRLRALVARAFTPKRVADLRPVVAGIAAELLDDIERGGSADVRGGVAVVDLVQALAYPLPVRVICALLGVPAQDAPSFSAWSRDLVRTLDPSVLLSPDDHAAIDTAQAELTRYLNDLLAQRRAQPRDDLLSALIAVEADGDRISPEEVVNLARLLLVAGHETTVNLIGNGVLALLRHPAQLAALRAQPQLLRGAVDELLRYDSPVQLTQRVAVADLELAGQRVRAGDELVLVLGAANRDPLFFAEPHALDVRRDAHLHVAFGGGIHHCLGAALARLEAEVALGALLDRFPHLALAGEPVRRPTFVLRGLESLPVELGGS